VSADYTSDWLQSKVFLVTLYAKQLMTNVLTHAHHCTGHRNLPTILTIKDNKELAKHSA